MTKKNLPKSNYQTNKTGHGIKITPWKTKKIKYKVKFSTNLMLKDEIKKIKNKTSQHKLIC